MVSHAIYTMLAIIALGSLILYASNARNDMNSQTVNAQMSTIAESVREDVVKLSLVSKYSGYPYNGTVSVARFDLDFPKYIGGTDYTLTLSENLITIESSASNVSKKVDIDVPMEGSAKMPAYLELVRTSSGDMIRVAER